MRLSIIPPWKCETKSGFQSVLSYESQACQYLSTNKNVDWLMKGGDLDVCVDIYTIGVIFDVHVAYRMLNLKVNSRFDNFFFQCGNG